MYNVMFICHGNICRSPMAKFVMKYLAEQDGVASSFVIDSCATSAEEIENGVGRPLYRKAKAMLDEKGIPYGAHAASQLKKEDYGRYDLFACMDDANVRNSKRILGGDPQNKVCKLLSFAGKTDDVSDPWYTDRFDIAFADIMEGCRALWDTLKKEGKV